MSDRELYEQKLQAKIDEWKAEAAKLRAKAEGASADARLEWKRQVDDLEDEIGRAEDRLRELRESSGDAWASVKQGAEDAWASISEGFKRAADRMGS
jgi:uncharacterized coiled-coil DUF342 family protein